MKFAFLWLYVLVLAMVWIFYVILSIHAKKFSKFSTVIDRNLKLLFIFLLFLSISWFLIIIFWNLTNFSSSNLFWDKPASVKVEKYDVDTNIGY